MKIKCSKSVAVLTECVFSVCLQLNDSFTLYKKEKAENDRMLNETNDRLQRQLTDLRSSLAKLTSQLEFSNKRFARSSTAASPTSYLFLRVFFNAVCVSVCVRYEMLQDTVSAYRREISALQDRNQKMAATAQRHEHIIHTVSHDLRQANEKLALEEVRKKSSSIILRIDMMKGRYQLVTHKQKLDA